MNNRCAVPRITALSNQFPCRGFEIPSNFGSTVIGTLTLDKGYPKLLRPAYVGLICRGGIVQESFTIT